MKSFVKSIVCLASFHTLNRCYILGGSPRLERYKMPVFNDGRIRGIKWGNTYHNWLLVQWVDRDDSSFRVINTFFKVIIDSLHYLATHGASARIRRANYG